MVVFTAHVLSCAGVLSGPVSRGRMGVPIMWTIFMVALAKKTALYMVGRVSLIKKQGWVLHVVDIQVPSNMCVCDAPCASSV